MEKMTVQQAINVMEKYTDITLSKVVIEAHNMAIEALEKQIPEKPHKINIANTSWCKGGIRFECPSCHKFLGYRELTYCGLCGQKLDWSE